MIRLIAPLVLLMLLSACGPAPTDETTSQVPPATASTTDTQVDPTTVTTETTAPPLAAEPRPQVVTPNTQADPEQAQPRPRPTVRPDVVLENKPANRPAATPPPGGLNVTEGPNVPSPTEPTETTEPVVAKPEKTRPAHDTWDAILRNHVSSTGQVNYRALKGNIASLDDYLRALENYPPQSDWSQNEIMAYWINAYNAYTIKLILNNYPVQSIKDIDGGNPWATKWIKIGGKSYSLNQIENDILRARYGDARIHFAVNCAAASCPPLHNRAFTAGNLNTTLQRLTRAFINNGNYNTLSPERVELSKIFEWYAGDFGSVRDYVNGYTDVSVTAATEVTYKEYDWGLNGR